MSCIDTSKPVRWNITATAHRAVGPTPDTLELVYVVEALAAQPPMQAVAAEFSVPHRTATRWITKARQAGLLDGITYAAGRQPDGSRRAD